MNNAFKTGASGLKSHQTRIDNIANNIANVQTTGFKKTDVEFEDLLYTQFDANDLSKVQGHGVKVQILVDRPSPVDEIGKHAGLRNQIL